MSNPKKLPEGQSALNDLYYRYKYAAASRKIDFILTPEKFKLITSQNCHYCGAYPKHKVFNEKQLKRKRSNGNYTYNGVDRKDNMLGYFFDNCVPCCRTCNLGKHTMTYDEYVEHLTNLVNHRNSLK